MKTTMMTLAFAAIAMTATANPKANNGHFSTSSASRVEIRHYNNRADWKHCKHNHLDRYGNKTYCNSCGSELVWKGNKKNGRYKVIPPRTVDTHNHFNHK
ncbi:MAG: hypothetical protein HUK05_06480 [Prevotella sp.]|nr:hypothetical protein [Prevotella sp.]MCF0208798.1 hypothetical protein [Bacteroidaceae bacterium]